MSYCFQSYIWAKGHRLQCPQAQAPENEWTVRQHEEHCSSRGTVVTYPELFELHCDAAVCLWGQLCIHLRYRA